jgi:CSLREA domain-containing protein
MRLSLRSLTALICLVAGLALAGPATAGAATFTVTKTADSADGACDADCSLREATIAANTSPGADTIVLPAGTYSLTVSTPPEEDLSAEGDLDITDDVTITGAGARSTIIDGNGGVTNERVLDIQFPFVANVSGVTVQGGRQANSNQGGGILVRSNNDGSISATLNLTNSAVVNNVSTNYGGGIDSDGNSNLTNVLLAGNHADQGGGAMDSDNPIALTNVTVSGNTANNEGGGLGIYHAAALNNVTVTGNTAQLDGTGTGGNGGGIADITDGGRSLTIANTIIAGNSVGANGNNPDCDVDDGQPSSITSLGHNLIGTPGSECVIAGPGDMIGANPSLGALADNGGPTFTHALLTGSAAINAGDPAAPGTSASACAATDQRGVSRPQGGACDIGAYELATCQGTVVNRVGTEGSDKLTGTAAADGFLLLGGNDTASGLGGNDAICGGGGKDKEKGGGGKDKLRGDDGKDKLFGGARKDRLKGGKGKDRLFGGGGKDKLNGGKAKDRCSGGGGKDKAKSCEREKGIP